MKCPFCGGVADKVVDSRESREGEVIRRRRECLACQRRFTSYERVEEAPLVVVKSDGRREEFDRAKILRGLRRACEKRPVSVDQVEQRGAVGDHDHRPAVGVAAGQVSVSPLEVRSHNV